MCSTTSSPWPLTRSHMTWHQRRRRPPSRSRVSNECTMCAAAATPLDRETQICRKKFWRGACILRVEGRLHPSPDAAQESHQRTVAVSNSLELAEHSPNPVQKVLAVAEVERDERVDLIDDR